MISALVLDFDGVIVDTETPLFHAWRHTYAAFGATPIPAADWCASLGRSDDDPLRLDPVGRLQRLLGGGVGRDEIEVLRRAERDRLLDAAPAAPGLEALLGGARRLGIPVAIASSSPLEWIERHLVARRLLDHFPVIACAGGGIPGKPDPAVYLRACERLGADPCRALAVEDSPHGITAAKAAGMTCIAVPTSISASLDLSHADAVVTSLADIDLASVAAPSTR